MHPIGLRFALLLTFAVLALGLYPGSARAQTPPSCVPGAGNCATVDQGGDLQVATVAQTGTGNAADIDQVGLGPVGGEPPPPFPPDGNVRSNWVDLVQVGSNNRATISQGPDTGGAWDAWGSYQNCVYLNQADGSIADVRQEGSYNRVWGNDSAYNAPEHGDSFDGSTLLVLQTGFANELYFDQQASSADVTQTGERNVAHVTQQ